MNKSELFYRTKVPVNTQESFQLFLLARSPSIDLERSVDKTINDYNLPEIDVQSLRLLDKDRFFEVLSLCNLTQTEQLLASRLNTVVKLSVQIDSEYPFESFWTLRKAAHEISQRIEVTNMLIDLDQGNSVSSVLESVESLNGIPLAKDYVTIKAYDGLADKTYVLESEGLVRFGLPEIALHEIPHNLGADGAYLIRTVAQYLLVKLESKDNELDYLTVNKDVTIPVDYCEFNNPYFHGVKDKLSAVSLKVDESRHNSIVYLEPCSDYEDYYDWLMEVLDSITQSRTKAHWIEEKAGKENILV